MDAGYEGCGRDDGGVGHEIVVRDAREVGRRLEIREVVFERGEYALEDC